MSGVGLVGLGAMGRPMALALSEAGVPLVVFDVARQARERAEADGLTVADDLPGLVRASDTVVLSLPTPAVVLAVVAEVVAEVATTHSAVTVLDTSTIDPATARRCHELMTTAGGDYADCPVLGRPEKVGAWTLPVGGSAVAHAHAQEVLGVVARLLPHVGGVGAAAAIKVLNNLMLGAINAVTAEVLVLAEAVGLDPGVFVDVVLDSGAASVSGLFRDVAPRAVDGDFEPTFSLRLMHKDNALALGMARDCGVPLLVGNAAQTLNTMGMASGHGDEDSIAVLRTLESVTGLTARRKAHAVVAQGDAG